MKAPRAVETLVVVNALIFGFQTLVGPAADAEIIRRFGLSTAGLETGALWQFITHAFLHGNIWHLLFNMVSLWFAGRIVEQTIGTRHFVLLYILSALGGGLGQILLGPENSQLIGASGAVFGVLVASVFCASDPPEGKISGPRTGRCEPHLACDPFRTLDRACRPPGRCHHRLLFRQSFRLRHPHFP